MSPSRKNAVLVGYLKRLHVVSLLIIVYFSLSSTARSSIFEVDIGSSADVGSSISGVSPQARPARALAMQSLCLTVPPESPSAFVQPVFHFVPDSHVLQEFLDDLVQSGF